MSRTPEAPLGYQNQNQQIDPAGQANVFAQAQQDPEKTPTGLEMVISTGDRHLAALREQISILDELVAKLRGADEAVEPPGVDAAPLYLGLVGEIEQTNRGFGHAIDDLTRKLARLGDAV